MNRDRIALIQQTWEEVELAADHAAGVFYARLFAIDPETRALFAAADMRQQRQKLMITLKEIVAALGDLDGLGTQLEELGRRHAAYGVTREHYVTVGEALLWMLEKVLGPGLSGEARAAWAEAYQLISDRMQRATGSNEITGSAP